MPRTVEIEGYKLELDDNVTDEQAREYIRDLKYRESFSKKTGTERNIIAGAGGVNRGLLADVPGAPVDLTTGLMNKAAETAYKLGYAGPRPGGEIPRIDKPFGGSESIAGVLPQAITPPSIQALPEDYRSLYQGMRTTGQSLGFGSIPLLRGAQLGTKPSQSMFAPIIEPARTRAGTMAIAETGSAVGAGTGGMIAEETYPGNPYARLGGELVGGFAAPTAILSGTTARTGQAIGSLATKARGIKDQIMGSLDPETAAARRVQEITTVFGDAPKDVAARLEAQTGGMPTAAASESRGIMMLEQRLIRGSHQLDEEMGRQTKTAIDEINGTFRQLQEIGTPEALRELAKLRQQHYTTLMENLAGQAEMKARAASGSVYPTEITGDLGYKSKNTIQTAYRSARGEENRLYSRVDREAPVATTPATRQILNKKNPESALYGLAPGESLGLPKPALKALVKIRQGKGTAGDIMRERGRVLGVIRNADRDKAGWRDRVRRLFMLADALADDLATVSPEAAQARDYSRGLHDVFTRGYAGDVLALNYRGGPKMEPETVLERGLSGRGEMPAVRSRQLEAAAEFDPKAGAANLQVMRDAEDQVIRDLATKAADPTGTGILNPDALHRYRVNNKALLERFPELDQLLSNAAEASAVYGKRIKRLQMADKDIRSTAAFAKILKVEDPSLAMKRAIEGDFPTRDIEGMFQLARKNPAATTGARTAYLDYLFNAATKDGMISGDAMEALLSKGNSLSLAKKYGIVSNEQMDNLFSVIGEAKKLDAARNFRGSLDQLLHEPDSFLNVMLRLAGANIGGSSVVAKTSGASLVMAGVGSRYLRKLFEDNPALSVQKVLQEAIKDKELMITLLRKPVGPGKAQATYNRLQNQLKRKGLIGKIKETAITPSVGFKAQILADPEFTGEEVMN